MTRFEQGMISRCTPKPHPMDVSEFVKRDLQKGIFITLRSPYINPTWVEDKKGHDDLGNMNKRLVIDFRKLNKKKPSLTSTHCRIFP